MISQQKDLNNLLKNFKENRFISHAYLIEKNNYDDFDALLDIIIKSFFCQNYEINCSKCSKCALIDNNIYDDLEIIEATGLWIKKEQLIKLQKEFQLTSRNGGKRLYVIKDVEKLTSSAGNAILKFLEEPPKDVHAVLVANSRFQVMPTILSRCQIIKLIPDRIEHKQIELSKKIYDFIDILNKYKIKTIAFLPLEIKNIFLKKEEAEETYEFLFKILYSKLKKGNYELLNQIEECLKCKSLIKNNVNLNLLLDKLIINLVGGLENEI